MVVFGEIGGVEWWSLMIGALWKTNREDRKRDICDKERENKNKITIYILQLLSVPSHF